MKKREPVEGCIGGARVHRHARAVLPASVLVVKSVVSLIVAARLVSTSPEMLQPETSQSLLVSKKEKNQKKKKKGGKKLKEKGHSP